MVKLIDTEQKLNKEPMIECFTRQKYFETHTKTDYVMKIWNQTKYMLFNWTIYWPLSCIHLITHDVIECIWNVLFNGVLKRMFIGIIASFATLQSRESTPETESEHVSGSRSESVRTSSTSSDQLTGLPSSSSLTRSRSPTQSASSSRSRSPSATSSLHHD
jgi:hypothetical protein